VSVRLPRGNQSQVRRSRISLAARKFAKRISNYFWKRDYSAGADA